MEKRLISFGVVLGVLLGLFITVLPAEATQKAFLVGIGHLSDSSLCQPKERGQKMDHHQGRNDVQKIKEVLISGYGVQPGNPDEGQELCRRLLKCRLGSISFKIPRPDLVSFTISDDPHPQGRPGFL